VEALGITASAFASACLEDGVRVRAIGAHQIRATANLDVDRAGIDRAAEVIRAKAAVFMQRV
jgi:threonine aldolase